MATRRESVILDLEDRVTPGLLRVAAAAEVADRALKGMGGSSTSASRGMKDLETETSKTARNVESGGRSIDKYSGRLGLLVSSLASVGPAAIPIAAVAVPAVTALGGGLLALGAGVGVTELAFKGLGPALTAFNKAALAPTATNIAAAQAAMDKLPPSAQALVVQLHRLGPELSKLRQDAAGGLTGGISDGLHSLLTDLPMVRVGVRGISGELGQMARESGQALASDKWRPFIRFAGTEAPTALHTLGTATGDVAHGLSQILMDFGPLNGQVDAGILKLAQDFDRWATSLDRTQGFQDFIAYIETNGPHVVSLLGDVGQLFVDIVKAAAPLGGPTLQTLDALVKVLDLLASSPLATPLLALGQLYSITKLVSRGYDGIRKSSSEAFGSKYLAGTKSAVSDLFAVTTAQDRARMSVTELAKAESERRANLVKGAAALGAFALVASGAADKVGLSNTAMLGMAGTMFGPWGAAVGAGVGLTMDLAHAQDSLAASVKAAQRSIDLSGTSVDLQAQAKSLAAVNVQLAAAQKNSAVPTSGLHPLQDFKVYASTISDLFRHTSSEAQDTAKQTALISDNLKTAFGSIFTGLGGSSKNVFGQDQVLTLQQLQTTANRVQPAMQALGISVGDLQAAAARGDGSLGHLVDRIVAFTARADSTAGKSKAVAAAFAQMSNQALTTDQRVQGLTSALDGLIDPMLNLGQAHDAFTKGLNDISQSLSKNSKTLHGNSDAAIQNRDAIRTQVTNLKAWVEAQAQAGVAPRKMTAALKEGRQAIIDEGHAAGLNKAQIAAMIDQMGLTPKEIKTTIQLLGAQQANGLVSGLKSQLEGLNGRVFSATVRVTREGSANVSTGGRTLIGQADGGTIPGPRHPYGDKIMIMAAPGEEVISNRFGQADRFRADRAAGRIPGYANGGTVAAQGHRQSPLEHALGLHQKALTADSAALQKHASRLSNLISAEQQYAQGIAQSLKTDLFAQGSIWSRSSGPGGILRTDIGNIRAFNRDLHKLSRKGVNGGFLADIAQSGNVQEATMLAGLSRSQLREDQRLFRLRARLAGRTGQYAAQERYGEHIREVRDEVRKERAEVRRLRGDVRHMEAELKKANAKAAQTVGKHISGAAATAKRRHH